MIKKILAISLLLIYFTTSYSQESGDYELFVEEAKELSNLYRGAAPLNYKFKYTGTYFAYSEEYVLGNVFYNDKLYKDVLLNLNSHLDELYVFVSENGMPVMLNKKFVEKFNIDNRDFINFKFNGTEIPLEDGYYEVLWSNSENKLIKKTIKKYEERINHLANLETNSKIERFFLHSDQYYLLKEGSVKEIKRVSHIRSFYGVSGSLIRKHIRDKALDVKHNKDAAFISIVEFVNSFLLPESR
ncbi:MAG: hypothetical protein WCR71_01640 [Bacteroidales bacterium]